MTSGYSGLPHNCYIHIEHNLYVYAHNYINNFHCSSIYNFYIYNEAIILYTTHIQLYIYKIIYIIIQSNARERLCADACILYIINMTSGYSGFPHDHDRISSSEDQETDNTPITRPLNELLPVHPPTHHPPPCHLLHHMN